MSRRRRAEREPEALAGGPARGRARVWSNAFIAGFLLLQLVVPIAYYARGGGSDERFTWRMFSTLRMRRCEVAVEETVERDGALARRTVDLRGELPTPWFWTLQRELPPVVAKFLRRRCESAEVREVVYRRTCLDTDGSPLPARELAWDCALPGARGEDRGA